MTSTSRKSNAMEHGLLLGVVLVLVTMPAMGLLYYLDQRVPFSHRSCLAIRGNPLTWTS